MSLEELTRKMSKYYGKHDLDIEYKPNTAKIPNFNANTTIPQAGQSNNPPSVKRPVGANAVGMASANLGAGIAKKQTTPVSQRQFGIGMRQPKPQPLPYGGKVSASLPQYNAVTPSGGSKVPVLPYYQEAGISSDTWKKQAEQLKQDVAQQQKTVRPWQNASSTMKSASYLKTPQAFQKNGRPMTMEKPESVVANEQKLLAMKADLATAQNQGYFTDYSEQWRAIEGRADAEDVKSKLARMASMKNNIGADMGQNIAAMNEYQRLRGELEGKGINAEGVADWLRRNSNVMEAYYQQQRDAVRADAHPIIESLKTVPQVLYGGNGVIAGMAQSAMNSRTGEYRPIDTMGDAFDIARARQTVRGTVGDNLGQWVYDKTGNQTLANAANFLYGTAMSGLDSAFIAALGGGATAAIGATGGTAAINGAASIILGSNAASETMMDVVERGGSTDQAVAAGILSGAAESIFEKVSIEGLIAKFKSGEKGFRAFIKNATLQGASEASEEMATEIANVIADYYVNGGISEIEQMRQSGMSDAEITIEIAKRVGAAGAGGFLMGFVGGGTANLMGNIGVQKTDTHGIVNDTREWYNNTGKNLADLDIATASWDEINNSPDIQNARERAKFDTPTIEDNSPERQQLRQQIADDLYALGSFSGKVNGEEVFNGPVKQERKAFIVIGPPAAGKSSVFANSLSQEHSARIIDSDMAKAKLPEFDDGYGAGRVHMESDLIASSMLYKQAVLNGDNILMPLVGKNSKKIRNIAKALKSEGYAVELYLNELPADKAARRSVTRFMQTGRLVDPEYVLSIGDKPTQTYEELKQEGVFDRYVRKSNDVAFGEQPILIEDTGYRLEQVQTSGMGRLDGGFTAVNNAGNQERTGTATNSQVTDTEPGAGFSMPETQRLPYAPRFNPNSQAQQLPYAPGYNASNSTSQPALPYNPNAPKPIPQNPAQGKFGGNTMGIVASPELAAAMQPIVDYTTPKPNPEGSRSFDGSVLDNVGHGQAAFATLDNLLAQSKVDAAKKPDAKEGIANVLTERPKKGVKENFEIAADFAARKLVDSGHTIDTIAKAVGDKVLYPLYNNAKQSRQAAEYMIGEAQADINGNRVGDSLVSIFDPIKAMGEDYFRDFSTYLYHVHNVDRMSLETNGAQVYQDAIMQLEAENPMLQNATREEVEALASGNSDYREAAIEWLQLDDSLNNLHNKPVFGESVTAEDSRKAAAGLLRKNPEFAELAERVYAYNRNLMKYRVDAGLVSQKQADIMNSLYPHYVPTFRDTGSTTGMKMGGNQATVARTVRSASGSNLDLMPIDGSMAEQTLQTVRAANTNLFGARLLEDALKHQDKVGRHIRSVVDKYNSYDMDEPPQYTGGITIYSGGKPVSMDADVGVMEAFKSIQPDPLEGSNIYRRIVASNNTFKALVTGANPMFLAKNFARDLQDAGLYAGDLKDFAKNYPRAWKQIATNGELWQLYKAKGGTGSSYFDYEKGLVDNSRKGIFKVFDRIEDLNMMVEQAPRFSEFMSVLEKEGRTYAGIQKAMLAAADVTVNFGRSGTLTKTLNKTFVPFLNPSVQGADKFIRRFAQTKGAKAWLGLIGRCALLGIAPGLLNELLHAGTEEEKEYAMLNDRDKETNYVFRFDDGVWIKVPRGRAVSIFGSAAQRTARMMKGEEDAWVGFIELALDQVGTTDPFTGHILSAYLNTELFNPESPGKTWYGSDIEPQRLQGLPPGERYDEKTDNLSKWLGKQLNISPKKINHLLDSYTGVIGDFALPLMTPRAERNPFAAAFSIDSKTSNKLQGEFYDKLDELGQNKNSANPDAGVDLAYSYLNGVSREVSDLNKQIRAIESDETLKDKDKREQTRKLAEERNALIQKALEDLPKYTEQAAAYKGDPDAAKREVNRKVFGAEYALEKYDKDVYAKAQKANAKGITYEDYYNYRFSVDANEDGSVNQEEAKKKLDSMNIPSYQKAFLWEQQNKSWKKNPYK